jgi:hypothetical protein
MERELKTAPAVYAMVPSRIINKRKVNEAMLNIRSIADFQGALTFLVLFEYIELYQLLDQVKLQLGVPDTHIWRLSTSGQFTTKSAYAAMFQGAIAFELAESGELGPLASAEFSFGWWSMIGAGRLTS